MEYVVKILVTSVLVVAASEAARRSTLLGAAIASLPLTSLLAIIWLWHDTQDAERVAALATGIFWMIVPSLALLLLFPYLLRTGWSFTAGLAVSIVVTAVAYLVAAAVLRGLGIAT